jgi:hypothetical protein
MTAVAVTVGRFEPGGVQSSKSLMQMLQRVNRAILPHFTHVRFPPNRVKKRDRNNFALGTNHQRCRLSA